MAPSYYGPRPYEELSAELRPTLHRLSAIFDDIAKLAPPDLTPGSVSRALVSACGGLASAATMIEDAGDYERVVDSMRALIGARRLMSAP